MNEEINKEEVTRYLTEAMREKYHEVAYLGMGDYECKTCRRWIDEEEYLDEHNTPSLSTAIGYDKLREFYDGWDDEKQINFRLFLRGKINDVMEDSEFRILHAFHKDNLAKLMMEFLQGEEK